MRLKILPLIAARLLVLLFAAWLALPIALCFADTPSFAETRTKAEQGNAAAQSNLGVMYRQGNGVTRDYGEAVKWYRKAAEQGYATAQFNLGGMYDQGNGVTRDYVESYVWFSLAAAQGDDDAKRALNLTERVMTPDQIAEAQKRAAAWRPSSSPAQ
jgi:TPR repeat protein